MTVRNGPIPIFSPKNIWSVSLPYVALIWIYIRFCPKCLQSGRSCCFLLIDVRHAGKCDPKRPNIQLFYGSLNNPILNFSHQKKSICATCIYGTNWDTYLIALIRMRVCSLNGHTASHLTLLASKSDMRHNSAPEKASHCEFMKKSWSLKHITSTLLQNWQSMLHRRSDISRAFFFISFLHVVTILCSLLALITE